MSLEQASSHNLLVSRFSDETFAALRSGFERIDMNRDQTVVSAGEVPAHIYFPEGGVYSIVARIGEGQPATEVGLFGLEGVSAISTLLGVETSPLTTITQVDGHTALKMETARLCEHIAKDADLRALVSAFAHVTMVQLASSCVAFSQHPLEVRLARWLLMCGDRVPTDSFLLTHKFISTMLGAYRSSVTVTLHALEGMGAIRSQRGLVIIRDRDKLVELAGKAYGQAEGEYRRLIGKFPQ